MFEEKKFKKKYKIQKRKLKEKEKRGENYKNRALECIFFSPSEKITLNISHFREIMGKIALKIHVEGQILKKILLG